MIKNILLVLLFNLPILSYASNTLEISTPGNNIGIGTNSVSNALSISNTLAVGGVSYTSTTAPTNGVIIQGNVGIGTKIPTTSLFINGGGTATELVNKGYELIIPSPSGLSGDVELNSFMVHKGNLYMTYGASNALYVWDGNKQTLLTSPNAALSASFAIEYQGNIYELMSNGTNGMSVYVSLDDGNTWSLSYASGADAFAYTAVVFQGKLYVGAGYGASRIYVFDGNTWSTAYAGMGGSSAGLVDGMYVYKGLLFAGIGNGQLHGGIISSSTGSSFNTELTNVTITRFMEFRGKLYATTEAPGGGLYVRNDVTATWSVVSGMPNTSGQCWGIANYNNALYVGCDDLVNRQGDIYKSYDGVSFPLDFATNGSSNAEEPFYMMNYNGSLYTGLGFQSSTTGDIWRKTDSVGQQSDWLATFLNKFRQNTYNGYNWPNDSSLISETSPFNFDSNVSIGSFAPINKLDVLGGIAVGASYGGQVTAPTNGMYIQGNVGIGTGTNIGGGAAGNLVIYNSSSVKATVYAASDSGASRFQTFTPSADGYLITYGINDGFGVNFDGRTSLQAETGKGITLSTSGLSPGDIKFITTGGSFSMSGANLGIGTASPSNTLAVVGNAAIGSTGNVGIGAPTNGLYVQGNIGVGSTNPSGAIDVGTGSVCINHVCNSTWPSGSGLWATQNTTDQSLAGGNVGIGTTLTTTSALTVMNGNVGIGTWIPATAIEFASSVGGGVDGSHFRISRNATQYMENFISSVGDVFIGNPGGTGSSLKLQLGQKSTNLAIESGLNSVTGLITYGDGFAGAGTSWQFRHYSYLTAISGAKYVQWWLDPSTSNFELSRQDSNVKFVDLQMPVLMSGGNVGIGSASPGQLLDVRGTIRGTDFVGIQASDVPTLNQDTTGKSAKTDALNSATTIVNVASATAPTSGQVLTATSGTSATWQTPSGGSGLWATQNTTDQSLAGGNVGIGTTLTTTSALTVMNGNVGIGTWVPGGSFIVQGGNVGIGTNSPNILLGIGATNQFNVNSNGNLGIGVINPAFPFQVTGAASGSLTTVGEYQNSQTANNSAVGFTLAVGGAQLLIEDVRTNAGASGNSDFLFTSSSGGATNRMILQSNGNVGIDTVSPGSILSVNGNESLGSYAIKTAPVGGIIASGNVGIGTYLPTDIFEVGNQKFDIVGNNVGIGSISPGQLLDVQGTVRMPKLGTTLSIASGSNGCQGQATLSSGTVTISTSCAPSSSQGIFLQDATTGSLVNVGTPTVGTVTGGTSFVINSSNALDSSNVNWWILKSS